MGYSIGLHTKSEEQAKEILKFIEKNIPQLRPETHYPMTWCTGKDMAYIEDLACVGTNDTPTDLLDRLYLYTIFYHIGIKFGLEQNINGVECVLVDYDSEENFCFSTKNPYPEYDEKYYSFCKIREDGIRHWEPKGRIAKWFGLEPNKKEIEFLQNIVKIIQEK